MKTIKEVAVGELKEYIVDIDFTDGTMASFTDVAEFYSVSNDQRIFLMTFCHNNKKKYFNFDMIKCWSIIPVKRVNMEEQDGTVVC